MSNLSNIAVIIPAYKPEPRLIDIVKSVQQQGYGKVLVVNDGQEQNREDIFTAIKAIPNTEVLVHAINMGKGAALKTAFNHILVHHKNFVGAVTMDADGQHAPKDVQAVAQTLLQKPQSLILGTREFKTNIPFRSQFGNILTRYVFHFLTGKKLNDTQTGLRGISLLMLKKLLTIKTNRYEFELDMLVLAATEKTPIEQVPIATIYEDGNKSSHFNPLLDSFRIYFVFVRFLFLSLITTFIDIATFSFVYYSSGNMLNSVTAGRIVGLLVNVTGSKVFVFKSTEHFFWILARYLMVWGSLFAASYYSMVLLVEKWQLPVLVSRVSVDSTLFFLNFLIQREFVFTRRWNFLKKEI